ncbi:tetratricopeptide repeat protein [Dyella sp. 333MFSha]|uniref:tetratricopeptide repeat protein n=1 Tax=Dyella sp. 333MFSha TaxID=1798240 RepID=UPI0011600106|nr:tetratricopeptide repeat protein [Dyella sp. 333MFSha]
MKPTLRFLPALCFMLSALVLAWLAYTPGLKGSFLFDDAANLPALGASGRVDNAAALLRYLTSGHADPTGRPVAVASFLLDARDWPASPLPFKRTNLLIHLLNGALLFLVLRRMGQALNLEAARIVWSAAIGSSAWLLHPFFVSTVLYIVQREAMLPATFALLALLCSFRSRTAWQNGRSRAGLVWLVLGVGGCSLLAFLAKANGMLVPLLVVLTHALLAPSDTTPGFRKAVLLILGPLAALPVVYVTWFALASIGEPPIPIRGWTVTQRLMTEPAILVDYVRQLWLLKITDSNLLHDDVLAATSLTTPWYTGLCVAAVLVAVLAAWHTRKRHPAVSLTILFFLAGHLMESSSPALELYFEHRNYLPAMLMFWPLGIVLTRPRSGAVALIGGGAIAFLLTSLSFANASLWGRPLDQATAWANAHPGSARAQAYAAQMELSAGRYMAASRRIEAAANRFRGEPQIALNQIDIHCAQGQMASGDLSYAREALRTAQREPGPLLLNWFEQATTSARAGNCGGLTRAALESILDAADANPRIAAIPGRRQDVLHARGAIALAWAEPDKALDLFNRALAALPVPSTALEQAAMLGRSGFPSHGERHLEYFSSFAPSGVHSWRDGMPWVHDRVLSMQGYWPNEIAHLRATLVSAQARDQ